MILSVCALPALIWVSLYGHPALGFSGLVAEQQTASVTTDKPPSPIASVTPQVDSPQGDNPQVDSTQADSTQADSNQVDSNQADSNQKVAEATADPATDADSATAEIPPNSETLAERPAEADALDALPETVAEDAAQEAEPELPVEVVADSQVIPAPEDRSIGDPPPNLQDSTDNVLAEVDTPSISEGTGDGTSDGTSDGTDIDAVAETPEYDEVAAQEKLAAAVEQQKTAESAALEKAGEQARKMAREHERQLAAREKAEKLAQAQVERENQALADAGDKARQMARDRKAQLLAAEAALLLEQQEKAAAASQQAREAQVARQDQALIDAGNRARQLASEHQAQQQALAAKQAAAEEAATQRQQAQAEQQAQALVEAGNRARQMLKELEAKRLAERESARKQQLAREQAQAAQQNQALLAAGIKARELAREAQAARQAEQQNQALLAAGEKARELARELARQAQAARQLEQQNQALVAAGDQARALAKAAKLAATETADVASLKLDINVNEGRLSAVMTESDIAESLLDKLVALLAPLPVTEDISYFSATRGGEQLLESLDLLVNELSASDVIWADAEMRLEITENSVAAEGQLDSDENAEALHGLLQSVFTDRDLSIRLNQQSSTDSAVSEPAENTFEAIRTRELALLTEQSDNLRFEPGEWVISQPLREPLDLIFETLFLYSEVTVNLTIYSGDSKDSIMNKFVSQQRARSVRRYLTDRGLEADRVRAIGAGNPDGGPVAEIEVMIKEN